MTSDSSAALISFINTNYRPASPVVADTELVRSEIVASYSILELITFIETEFDLQVPDEDVQADNFRTVEAMLRMIDGLRTNHDAA